MPSAEAKQENMASSDSVDPFQKAITYLKFKIKNMDQRKKNLETIKEKLDAGMEKELELAQVNAASKLPEVSSNISFLEQTLARLQTHHDEHVKLDRARKQQAKQERYQLDLERVRRILVIQDALGNVDDRVREDLLAGRRGAPQLTEADLKQLDTIFKLVTPSRDEADVPIKDQLVTAAEHLLRLADRSQKKVIGTTYENLTKLLETIFESGVLSEEPAPAENGCDGAEHGAEEPAPAEEAAAEPEPAEAAPEPQQEQPPAEEEQEPAALLVPGPAPGSAGDSPPYPQEVLLAPAAMHPAPAMVPMPMPVPVPVPQQPSINFLQESELLRADPSVLDPAVVRFSPAAPADYPVADVHRHHAIPSQTFTNTNFAGLPPAAALSEYVAAGGVYAAGGGVVDTTPNPPPPIPLPNHEPGDTEIGQWNGGGGGKSWDNGGKADTWENGGDNHWNGTDVCALVPF
ncbi:caprin-1-like [Pollicipes pollicipes]|uniref:caprin-1-like n=1 Tax=Pollicipes pollicipes TaxID=41117 RepID=UPI001884BFE7|nr:caprin-1-like [Pollicipes pollicipes]